MVLDATRVWKTVAAVTAALTVGSTQVQAKEDHYPSSHIRLLVGSAPGGGADIVARMVAQHMTEVLKQTVVVENRAGASGQIAASTVRRSPADGYTLLLALTTFTQLPAVQSDLQYDPIEHFTPISLVARSNSFLMVNRDLGVNSLSELVGKLKADSDEYSFGSWGIGSTGHLWGEWLNLKAGVKSTHVPFQGSGPMVTNLLGGVVSYAFVDTGAAQPHMGSDRVQALAVTGDHRLENFPDMPTMAEAGIEGFEASGWLGVLAPLGTPEPIIATLEEAISGTAKDPALVKRMVELGIIPEGSTAKEFDAFLRNSLQTWVKVADLTGTKN